jgi:hypothetical protein
VLGVAIFFIGLAWFRYFAFLHSEPGDVFFGLAIGTPGAVEFTALEGRVCLSGDYGFGM